MDRNAVTSAKRIVIKIGSSSLTGTAGSQLDAASVEKIVSVIAALKARGAEVALVSSGAIAAKAAARSGWGCTLHALASRRAALRGLFFSI